MTPRPLHARVPIEEIPFAASDGAELGLARVVVEDPAERPAVLLLHGHTASSDMFVLPETRNLVDVLLDAGYEPWLADWRGSCRLPHNDGETRYSYDDVALYDVPEAVAAVRARIGGRQLFVVAHCVGALTLSMSMAAGLVPGLAAVVAQGVFLTPKLPEKTRWTMLLGGELLRSRLVNQPVDIRRVGLWSRHTPLFALAARGADCPDPTCQILHNSAWGVGASLYVHENIGARTHDRLAELFGPAPLWILPHLRKIELAHAVVRWAEGDRRYARLPESALDHADRIDCPLMLVSGSENGLWADSNELCRDVLARRFPQLDVRYLEVPGYGHVDTFIGHSAALDVFGPIVDFLDEHRRAALPAPASPAANGEPSLVERARRALDGASVANGDGGAGRRLEGARRQ